MKTCKICKEEKELEEFYKNGKAKDGRNSYCKECDKKAAKKRYETIKADPELWAKEIKRVAGYMRAMRQKRKGK